MALPDPQIIKQAILHPQWAVRQTALRYFIDAHSTDTTILPRVIEAVQHLGPQQTWPLVAAARSLPQTAAALDWALDELKRSADREDLDEQRYHGAVAAVIADAPLELLAQRRPAITELVESPEFTDFPELLWHRLRDRLRLSYSNRTAYWAELEQLARQGRRPEGWTRLEEQRAGAVVEALANQGDGCEAFVLELIQRQFPAAKRDLYEQLEPQLLDLAGRMRLDQAVPVLIERLGEEGQVIADAAVASLSRIGSDAVVREIGAAWAGADASQRYRMAEVLGRVRTETAAEYCLALLDQEPDAQVRNALEHAALNQLQSPAIRRLVPLLRGEAGTMPRSQRELRLHLVEVATILGLSFDEYEAWYGEAKRTPWGWSSRPAVPAWLSSALPGGLTEVEPALTYRMCVTLEAAERSVWRCLQVPDCSLADLHLVLQRAMGSEQVDSWTFCIDGSEYGDRGSDEHEDSSVADGRSAWLRDIVHWPGQRLTYVSGAANEWVHRIEIEQISELSERDPGRPRCLDGAGAYFPDEADVVDLEEVDFRLAQMNDELEEPYEEEPDLLSGAWDEDEKAELSVPGYELRQFLRGGSLSSRLRSRIRHYPFGAITRYGADHQTTTKIVAAVFPADAAEPIIHQWIGAGVADDLHVQQEVANFFKSHGVHQILSAERNVGCPHEPGKDYPLGDDCPACPYWRGLQ